MMTRVTLTYSTMVIIRKSFKHTEEGHEKLSQGCCTVTRATEDAIIDYLQEGETSWGNV